MFPCNDVPFGSCVDTAPHLGAKLPKNPNLEVLIGISKTNTQNFEAYYKNYLMDSNQILRW